LYELPAALGYQLIACYWLSQGLEVELVYATDPISIEDNLARFQELSTRSHLWQLEQP
jgi:hypothetical protein